MRISIFALCLLLLSAARVPLALSQDRAVALTVSPDESLGTISPYVYGSNYGPWALVSPDMLTAAAESGVTHLRFPAGAWGDDYDLTAQQIDLFFVQAEQWGVEPSISVRLAGGSPERAAELVSYINIEKQHGVRYWSIGNEPDLYDDYSVEQHIEDWRTFAQAMLEVDPSIVLIGPEVSQFPSTVAGDDYTNVRREWVRRFLETNGDLVDIVSVHRYPFPRRASTGSTTIEDLRQDAPQWDVLVQNLRDVVQETVGRELPLAVTEVNSHWTTVIGGEATPDSLYNAVWWADVLGRLIRQRVTIVNYFMLSSYGNLGAHGLLDRYDERPTYYTYQLYRQFGSELLASATNDSEVTITAARRDDGALTLMLVNLTAEDVVPTITLEGLALTVEAEVFRLDAEHYAESVGVFTLTNGGAVELPAQSVTLMVLPPT